MSAGSAHIPHSALSGIDLTLTQARQECRKALLPWNSLLDTFCRPSSLGWFDSGGGKAQTVTGIRQLKTGLEWVKLQRLHERLCCTFFFIIGPSHLSTR